MCGIIFGRRNNTLPVAKNIFKRYIQQQHRGQEGFGYVAIENGFVKGIKRFTDEKDVKKSLLEETSNEILFHHRFPTSTPNFKDLNHPIKVSNKMLKYDYYIVHNGIIRNPETLRTRHEKMGFEYTTVYQEIKVCKTKTETKEELIEEQFNDSESLAIEIALSVEDKTEEIKAVGTIAFIAIQTNKKGKVVAIFYGRNEGNPLIVEKAGTDLVFIKSEGSGEKIDSGVIMREDYLTHKLTELDKVAGKMYEYQYTGYSNGYKSPSTYGYNTNNVQRLAPSIYDDDMEEYIPASPRKTVISDEDLEDDEAYALYRMGEVEKELVLLYEAQALAVTTIAEFRENLNYGKTFDKSLYDLSLIEIEKEETSLDELEARIDELEQELCDIVETTGLESTMLDFSDEEPETKKSEKLKEFKDTV